MQPGGIGQQHLHTGGCWLPRVGATVVSPAWNEKPKAWIGDLASSSQTTSWEKEADIYQATSQACCEEEEIHILVKSAPSMTRCCWWETVMADIVKSFLGAVLKTSSYPWDRYYSYPFSQMRRMRVQKPLTHDHMDMIIKCSARTLSPAGFNGRCCFTCKCGLNSHCFLFLGTFWFFTIGASFGERGACWVEWHPSQMICWSTCHVTLFGNRV